MKAISLKDKNGAVIGVFSFNPADTELPARLTALCGRIPRIIAPLAHITIAADGTASGADRIILTRAERQLFRAIDAATGIPTAAELFQAMRPFASVGGRFWSTQAVLGICKHIEKEIGGTHDAGEN